MRKLLSLFVAALFSVTMFADVTKVYCKVDQAWWLAKNDKGVAGAVAAHYWTEGEGAVSTDWPGERMQAVEGETNVWSLDIDPAKAQKIIFVRVPATGDLADWGAKSKAQTFPANDETLFTITNETAVWGDPGCDGVWSKFVPSEPEPEPEYFLARASNEWAVVEADKFAATATEGEFKLTATLVLDDAIKVVGIAGEDTTWYPAGYGTEFTITEKYTGEHDIYFRPAGNSPDWDAFGGFFWMGANPDPEPELKDLFLVPNQWANEDAKIAAWYWKKGEGGEWTSFLAPKAEGNDTLVAKVNVEADSIIFVRFSAAQEAPAWMGPNQLNQTANDSIQWAKAVCTILPGGGYESKATWDVYVPEPKGKYYIIGDAGIVGEEKAWQPDGIKAMTDTTVLNIKAGSYSMRLTLDGTWEGGQRDYRHLTEITPGLGEYVDDYSNHNITFTLDVDGEVTVIYIAAHDEEPEVFKVLGNFHVAKNGYFLFGSHNDWALVDEQKFEQNGAVEGEYKLVITLVEGEEIKPALVKNDKVADEDWFGSNYTIKAADAGEKTIYFRPAGNSEWEAFGGFIWIENGTTGVEETAVEGKAVKALRDGQLIIIKNGVRYNVIGIRF